LKPVVFDLLSSNLWASTNPKPFQGLKRAITLATVTAPRASTNPKPFQGLKQEGGEGLDWDRVGFNQPKTLSGIET